MLQVYIAEGCLGSAHTHALLEQVRQRYPAFVCEIVNVDRPGAVVPEQIIGTPIYCWEQQIIFFGNPSVDELLAYLRTHADERSSTR